MRDSLDRIVIPAFGLLGLGLWIYFSSVLTRIFTHLREKYPILSESLRIPPFRPFFVLGLDVLIIMSVVGRDFTQWIMSGDYKKLQDPKLTALVVRLKSTVQVLVGFLVFIIVYSAVRVL
jgi:hypothetical protein